LKRRFARVSFSPDHALEHARNPPGLRRLRFPSFISLVKERQSDQMAPRPQRVISATGRQQKPDQAIRLRVSCLLERLPSIEGQPAVASQHRRRRGPIYALSLAKSTPNSNFLSRSGSAQPKPKFRLIKPVPSALSKGWISIAGPVRQPIVC